MYEDRLGSYMLVSLEFSWNLSNYAILLGEFRDYRSFTCKLIKVKSVLKFQELSNGIILFIELDVYYELQIDR